MAIEVVRSASLQRIWYLIFKPQAIRHCQIKGLETRPPSDEPPMRILDTHNPSKRIMVRTHHKLGTLNIRQKSIQDQTTDRHSRSLVEYLRSTSMSVLDQNPTVTHNFLFFLGRLLHSLPAPACATLRGRTFFSPCRLCCFGTIALAIPVAAGSPSSS